MILKLRERMANREEGFTLIELLVVMLSSGSSRLSRFPRFSPAQQGKRLERQGNGAHESGGAETIATDNNGSYTTVSPTTLKRDRFFDPDGGRFTAASVCKRREQAPRTAGL